MFEVEPKRQPNVLNILERTAHLCRTYDYQFSHDLLGQVFHPLITKQKNRGSFYTKTAAATLLAKIAYPERPNDELASIRLIDPACGTGTLLMAASQRLKDLYGDNEKTAKTLIEKVVYGCDIDQSAVHMAATTMGLIAPTVEFEAMNVGAARFGQTSTGAEFALGSLDLANRQDRLIISDQATATNIESEKTISVENNSFDLVIMNPPYLRINELYKHLNPADEKAARQSLRNLIKNLKDTGTHAADPTSLGTMFIDLGHRLLKNDRGCLAFVYPAAAANAPSSRNLRSYLANHFQIETVITSHDSQTIGFSENTAISEILVVARRRSPQTKPKPTRFVYLFRFPETATRADRLAEDINNKTESADFTTKIWPAAAINQSRWRSLTFVADSLTGDLEIEKISQCPKAIMGDQIEPGANLIQNHGFKQSSTAQKKAKTSKYPLINRNDSKMITQMEQAPEFFLEPQSNNGSDSEIDRIWQKRSGHLFLPNQIRLNTNRVVCLKTAQPAAADGQWHLLKLKPTQNGYDQLINKSICLYLNSIIGFVNLIGRYKPRILSRPVMNKDDLKEMVWPDFSQFEPAKLKHLGRTYDGLKNKPLAGFYLWCQDPIRNQIDQAIGRILEIDKDLIKKAQADLSREMAIKPSKAREQADKAQKLI